MCGQGVREYSGKHCLVDGSGCGPPLSMTNAYFLNFLIPGIGLMGMQKKNKATMWTSLWAKMKVSPLDLHITEKAPVYSDKK